jgi:hypothetical protein
LNAKIYSWQSFFPPKRRKAIGIGAVFSDGPENLFSRQAFLSMAGWPQ